MLKNYNAVVIDMEGSLDGFTPLMNLDLFTRLMSLILTAYVSKKKVYVVTSRSNIKLLQNPANTQASKEEANQRIGRLVLSRGDLTIENERRDEKHIIENNNNTMLINACIGIFSRNGRRYLFKYGESYDLSYALSKNDWFYYNTPEWRNYVNEKYIGRTINLVPNIENYDLKEIVKLDQLTQIKNSTNSTWDKVCFVDLKRDNIDMIRFWIDKVDSSMKDLQYVDANNIYTLNTIKFPIYQ